MSSREKKEAALARLTPVVKSGIREFGRGSAAWRPAPDFLIIGAKRGGTTSLWNWLLQHPHVLPMLPARQHIKSPHYFYRHYDRGPAWYRSFYPTTLTRRRAEDRLGGPVVSGEASPYYLFDPRVAARVARDLPLAKIIILLRNPVDRAASHHRERMNAGVEVLDLDRALEAEPGRLAGELERMERDPLYYSERHDWFSYRARGIYAPQLALWRQHVPDERLLVLRSEDMYADPLAIFRRVTDFLGVPHADSIVPRRHNYHPHDDLTTDQRSRLHAFFEPHNAQLGEALGPDFVWPR